uniref:Uncharacterized protein n=1 Tax=Amphimedon queenslandica TaxID=400682 RepID=A0A1X7T1X1_AMPQE
MHSKARTVPVNTKVTLKCFTSSCEHAHMITKQPERELDECSNIQNIGILTCNITIVEPVEVRCVGVHPDGCAVYKLKL